MVTAMLRAMAMLLGLAALPAMVKAMGLRPASCREMSRRRGWETAQEMG